MSASSGLLLRPLSWLYRAALTLHSLPWQRGWRRPGRVAVPVVVVGNLVVGGAGKTPTVLALVAALRAAGWHPGVVSRGHGRRDDGVCEVLPHSPAQDSGDEPLLIRRRAGVPVWVGRRRLAAARALISQHPEVDVLVADDGLQHRALARDLEIVVFDTRGVGNGRLLPAGPLREPFDERRPRAEALTLYHAQAPSTAWPGALATRALGVAVPLQDWHAARMDNAVALDTLRGRALLAVAGIATPSRFFALLGEHGLRPATLALPDHHDYDVLPWPEDTAEVIVTEKDAVKLAPARCGRTRVWVAPLDLALPDAFVQSVLARLQALSTPARMTAASTPSVHNVPTQSPPP